jgi:alpha-tubulin suppressor-like RCC1 family protein
MPGTNGRTSPRSPNGLGGSVSLAGGARRAAAVVGLCLVVVLAIAIAGAASASASGSVATWGDDSVGQLGDGSAPELCGGGECSTIPAEVAGLTNAKAVAGSSFDDLALLESGSVMAWGFNGYGELGNGSQQRARTPIEVPGLTGVTAVASGGVGEDSLALLSDGHVMTWGGNAHGQLGDGSFTGPETCSEEIPTETCSTHPQEVEGLSEVVAVAGGQGFSLALLADGHVMAWGANETGELGNGTRTDSDLPHEVPGLAGVKAIAAGTQNGYALLDDGTVMSWGLNTYYTLGDGLGGPGGGSMSGPEECAPYGTCSKLPVAVHGLSTVRAIAAGGGTSAMALLEDGTVEDWGTGFFGEIGDGSLAIAAEPVEVTGLSGVTAIASGQAYNTALLSDGTVMSWGVNAGGRLGTGKRHGPESCTIQEIYIDPCSDIPVAVTGLSDVTALASGEGDLAIGAAAPPRPPRPDTPPTVVTGGTSPLSLSSETANASVDPNGVAIEECYVEYGPTSSYGSVAQCGALPGSGTSPVPVSAALTGLALGTTYHYRIVAENAYGEMNEGLDQVFTTLLSGQSGTSSTLAGSTTAEDGPTLSANAYDGEGTLTVGEYSSDPVGSQPLRGNGIYFDVFLSPGNTFAALEFTDCELNGASELEWWNPAAGGGAGGYEAVSDETAPSGSPPCITVTVNNSTSPDLAQMTGTVFVGVVAAGPTPTLKKLSAKKGSTAGGTAVTITGTGFAGVSEVKFGSKMATKVTYHSNTSITAISPPASGGKVDVTVTTPNGTSAASSKYAFTYKAPKKKK